MNKSLNKINKSHEGIKTEHIPLKEELQKTLANALEQYRTNKEYEADYVVKEFMKPIGIVANTKKSTRIKKRT